MRPSALKICAATMLGLVMAPADIDARTASVRSVQPRLTLQPCSIEGVSRPLRCGVHLVLENRARPDGRKLPLKIVVIPALNPDPQRAPVYFLAGGPGETVTELVAYILERGEDPRDVVLVDERGTGDGHRLDCRLQGTTDNPAGFFKPFNDTSVATACGTELEKRFDLSQFSTAAFVEDLEEVRQALGHAKIDLDAGSFGTYAAMMYMRRYGANVRSAFLVSPVPQSNRVPLYHAAGGQYAIEMLFDQCANDAGCRSAYPRLRADFAALMAQVRGAPVQTWVTHPRTGGKAEVLMSEAAFVEAVRVMMYSSESARRLPLLITQAMAGDFNPFAEVALRTFTGIFNLRLGLNYAVTCNEFVSRIRPDEVEAATRGSYYGAWRVKGQMAVCATWPRTSLPDDFFAPFRSDIPVIMVSGDTDPASPPRWGESARSFLTRSVHLVVKGAGHMPDNACIRAIRTAFARAGDIEKLDLSCMATIRSADFVLPER